MQPRVEEKSEPGLGTFVLSDLQRLRVTLDSIPALLHSAEPDGSLDYFNQRWLDYLGVTLDDIKGWRWLSKIHPEDSKVFVEKWRHSIGTSEPLAAEARVRRQDGVYRWMLHRKVPLRDEQGKVMKWHGSSIDIHDRKQAEDALRLSQACMAHAQRLAQIGSWAYRFSDEVHWDNPEHWSAELWRITDFDPSKGFPPNELIFARIHPEDRERVVEATTQTIKSGQALNVKYRYFRADGTLRVFCSIGTVIPTDDAVKRYVGATVDVTEQERVLDELKRSEFYITEGERLSHVGSWAFTAAGFDHWSSELFRIHGLDPSAKAPGLEEYLALVHPEDREIVAETIQKMLGEGRGFDFTKRIVRPDGEIRRVRCVGVPATHGGASRGFVGTGMDVTEQERTLDELKRSEFYLAEGQRLGHAGSWSFKPDLTCDYWSRELYEILGFDPQNGIPTISDYFTRVHPEDRAVVEATIRGMIAAGEGCDLKKRIIRPDGVQRVIRCVGMAVREKGIVTRFVGTLMDITEQETLTQELRRREACLAEAQRLSQTGSFDWNVVTGEQIWSEENYRILAYDRSVKPSFERVRDRVHPDDLQLWLRAFAQASEGKQVDFEHRLLMPDGTVKHLHVVAYGVQKDGKFVELVGTAMDITERKRAEETIRRSEAYLTDAQKLSQTGSWAWSPDTGVRYWSEECYRVLGFDPRDGPPRTEELIQRIHPDDQPAFRKSVKRATHTKLEEKVDYRIVHPGGAVRHIHSIGHPVFSSTGDLIEFMGTVIDVTERKRAEEELRTSERKYRNLVDTTPAFIHTASPDGALDFLSRGWLEYGGLILSDLKDWRWAAAIHPEDVEGFVDKWRAALASGEPFEAESRVRRADGEYCWFLQRNVPFRDETGKIVKWYGTGVNISERKIAEEAIRRGEAFLAEGQRLSHTGSWGWNASTGKVTWSQEHFRILGLDPQTTNLSLDLFWERVHPDDRIGLRRTFESAIRDKRDFEQEFRIVTPDWSIRHLHGVGHAILNEANQLVEFIGSAMDITERKRAEERAQSQREAMRLALNAFVEELDVNLFLGDVIAELNKQFHAKSWELWLFDEPLGALVLHSFSHPTEYFSHAIGSKNARPLEELLSIWPIKDAARAPQILELSAQDSLLSRRHGESLTRRGIKTLMIVPLVLGEQNLGFLELHFQSQTQFSSDDLELAQALVNHATLALQLNRLTRRAEELAVTEERYRLAREIHDTLAQAFAGIVLHSEVLGASLAVSKQRSAKALSQIQKLARSGLEEARRSVQALRPKALVDNTLPEALRQAAIRLNDDGKLSCQFRQRGKKVHLPGEIQNELFRIGQEALTNVVKHAQAQSVYITLVSQPRRVTLSIKDDGVGFAIAKPQNQSQGFGMGTMRERAQAIGGRLRVESRPGRGTTIRVELPLSPIRSKKKVTL